MSDGDREHLLQPIASTAVKMLSPALHAGLTIFSRGKLTPRASTGEAPLLLDRLQQELGDGPCINAARHQSIFRIEDTGRDKRWPQFNAEAARLNVRSMLCVPLWIDERSLGALSLYAGQVAAFTDLHERITILLATFAAPALAEAQRAGQLQEALGNRDVIGQAKGILMERHSITADTAFGVLSRVSQAENMKLAEIARHLTETGKLGVSGVSTQLLEVTGHHACPGYRRRVKTARPEESQPPAVRRGSASWGVTVASVPQLNVTIKQHGQVCVLSVSGELDIATAPILAGHAAALHGLAGRLIVDLSGLEFMDGRGARTLAAVTSAAPPGCPVLVRGLTRRFRKIFDILALPLERHGEVTISRAEWAMLESQMLRSWAQQARADSQALIARSRQVMAAGSARQAGARALAPA